MASVQLTIKDLDATQIGVDIHLAPQFPDSHLLYTNAQMLGRELIGIIQQMSAQINAKQAHKQVLDSTNSSMS